MGEGRGKGKAAREGGGESVKGGAENRLEEEQRSARIGECPGLVVVVVVVGSLPG